MSCNKFARPTSVKCGCGAVVPVGPRGRVPWRCKGCVRHHKEQAKLGLPVPSRPSRFAVESEDPRELGPARPLLGMTEGELAEWRAHRAVHLYRTQEELRVSDIAERLGVTDTAVHKYLDKAGISLKQDGRGGRALLAAGPPVA